MIEQDLWEFHYQILSIIFLKKFIELNVNSDTMIKKCETGTIKCKDCDSFLEYIIFGIFWNANICGVTKVIHESLMKS